MCFPGTGVSVMVGGVAAIAGGVAALSVVAVLRSAFRRSWSSAPYSQWPVESLQAPVERRRPLSERLSVAVKTFASNSNSSFPHHFLPRRRLHRTGTDQTWSNSRCWRCWRLAHSAAVAKKVYRTAYSVRYSCRTVDLYMFIINMCV